VGGCYDPMDLEVGEQCSRGWPAHGDFLLHLNDSGEDLEYTQSVAGVRAPVCLDLFLRAPRTHALLNWHPSQP